MMYTFINGPKDLQQLEALEVTNVVTVEFTDEEWTQNVDPKPPPVGPFGRRATYHRAEGSDVFEWRDDRKPEVQIHVDVSKIEDAFKGLADSAKGASSKWAAFAAIYGSGSFDEGILNNEALIDAANEMLEDEKRKNESEVQRARRERLRGFDPIRPTIKDTGFLRNSWKFKHPY